MTASRLAALLVAFAAAPAAADGTKTWDGKYPTARIEVTAVYFVPQDRTPLPDWRERVDYYLRRIEAFHAREFGDASRLTTTVRPEPFVSAKTTTQLRVGDANAIYGKTLSEVDAALEFGQGERGGFPILLVLSDVNWKPLDDFYRLRPDGDGFSFDGQLLNGRHHPGSGRGGARAAYLADRGVGWGLVSADGWRVPYIGSDCVVYHEGVGHTVGLPHPEPQDGSVMSLAQYQGWLSESWLDEAQKRRLGWTPPETPFDRKADLFTTFRALPDPAVPKPGEAVSLALDWPAGTMLKSLRTRVQTRLFGPWIDIPGAVAGDAPDRVPLGDFDRPTPVSYRVDAETADGRHVELWGYFQVRATPEQPPLPDPVEGLQSPAADRAEPVAAASQDAVDLLALVDPVQNAVSGTWTLADGRLESPKQYGARIELPYVPPAEYRLVVIAEPLDEPRGLILGQRSGGNRFLVLLNYVTGDSAVSAVENVDGKNFGNETTLAGPVLTRGRPSQIVCEVRKTGVRVSVDGRPAIDWTGDPSRLSLSDYWTTPHADALFLGAYDGRVRFSRVTLEPLTGKGRPLGDAR